MRKTKRLLSAFLALLLSLAVICAEMPVTAYAAYIPVHLGETLHNSNWSTYSIYEGDSVYFKLEDIAEKDDRFMEAYFDDTDPEVSYYDPVTDMLQELKPTKKGNYTWNVPMGIAGHKTNFYFQFSNGDLFESDEYLIEEQPDFNMGTKTIDLREGSAKITGTLKDPFGHNEDVFQIVLSTVGEASDFGLLEDELDWIRITEEDVFRAKFDLDDDGSKDISFTMSLDGESLEISRLSTCSISGDFTIKLDSPTMSYCNCRHTAYFNKLTFKLNYPISKAKVTLKTTSYTYDGSAKKPAVTVVYDGKTLTKGTDYTVSYSNNKNAGTAKAIITGKGSYGGKITKSFTIKPKAVTPKVTLSAKAYTYNGKVKKPTVTVKVGTKTLASTDYTVTYASGRKNVGSYKVTVKLKGNYSGSKAVSFKINPKGTTLSTLTAASKAITVKWKKQATKMATSTITGYEIQLATDSAFTKNVKKVTVAGYTKVSKKVTGLLGARTYYVRVRTYKTVDGTKYYSDWSAVKTVKTKK